MHGLYKTESLEILENCPYTKRTHEEVELIQEFVVAYNDYQLNVSLENIF